MSVAFSEVDFYFALKLEVMYGRAFINIATMVTKILF